MKRRVRPLDPGERRAIQGSSIVLELELLGDEGDYCARWPDTPLARILASRAESDAAASFAASSALIPLRSANHSNSNSNLQQRRANQVKVPEVVTAGSSSSAAASSQTRSGKEEEGSPPPSELQMFLEALRPSPAAAAGLSFSAPSTSSATSRQQQKQQQQRGGGLAKGSSSAAATAAAAASSSGQHPSFFTDWDAWKVEQQLLAMPRFILPQEWAQHLSGFHAPWSRRIERLYEDLIVALEQEIFDAGGQLPHSVTSSLSSSSSSSSSSYLTTAGNRSRREALQTYARAVWNQLIAAAAPAISNNSAGSLVGSSECDLGEAARLWAARRMASARPGHEFGIPLVPQFFMHAVGFDEYFLPVHSAESDEDVESSSSDEINSSVEDSESSSSSSSSSSLSSASEKNDASDKAASSSSSSSSDDNEGDGDDAAKKIAAGSNKRKGKGGTAAAVAAKPKKASTQPPAAKRVNPKKATAKPAGKQKSNDTDVLIVSDDSLSTSSHSLAATSISFLTPQQQLQTPPSQQQQQLPVLRFSDVANPAMTSVLSFASPETVLALLRDLHQESVAAELAELRRRNPSLVVAAATASAAGSKQKQRKTRGTAASRKLIETERKLQSLLRFIDDDRDAAKHDDDVAVGAARVTKFLDRHLEESTEEELRNSLLVAGAACAIGDQESRTLFEEEMFEF